jgi:hypothetical protein
VCVGEIYSTSIRPPELPLLFYKTQLSCYAFNRWPPEPRGKGQRKGKGGFLTKKRKIYVMEWNQMTLARKWASRKVIFSWKKCVTSFHIQVGKTFPRKVQTRTYITIHIF